MSILTIWISVHAIKYFLSYLVNVLINKIFNINLDQSIKISYLKWRFSLKWKFLLFLGKSLIWSSKKSLSLSSSDFKVSLSIMFSNFFNQIIHLTCWPLKRKWKAGTFSRCRCRGKTAINSVLFSYNNFI